MKNYSYTIVGISALGLAAVILIQKVQAQIAGPQPVDKNWAMMADAAGAKTDNQESSPIYGVTIPDGYRDWKVIAVDQLLVPGKAAAAMKVRLPGDPAIDAEVDLLHGNDGFFLQARLNVSLPGLDRQAAQTILEGAHKTCPYSKATRGNIKVKINLIDT